MKKRFNLKRLVIVLLLFLACVIGLLLLLICVAGLVLRYSNFHEMPPTELHRFLIYYTIEGDRTFGIDEDVVVDFYFGTDAQNEYNPTLSAERRSLVLRACSCPMPSEGKSQSSIQWRENDTQWLFSVKNFINDNYPLEPIENLKKNPELLGEPSFTDKIPKELFAYESGVIFMRAKCWSAGEIDMFLYYEQKEGTIYIQKVEGSGEVFVEQ